MNKFLILFSVLMAINCRAMEICDSDISQDSEFDNNVSNDKPLNSGKLRKRIKKKDQPDQVTNELSIVNAGQQNRVAPISGLVEHYRKKEENNLYQAKIGSTITNLIAIAKSLKQEDSYLKEENNSRKAEVNSCRSAIEDVKVEQQKQLKLIELLVKKQTTRNKPSKQTARIYPSNTSKHNLPEIIEIVDDVDSDTTFVGPQQSFDLDQDGIMDSPGARKLKQELQSIYSRDDANIYCYQTKGTISLRDGLFQHLIEERIPAGEFADSQDMIDLQNYFGFSCKYIINENGLYNGLYDGSLNNPAPTFDIEKDASRVVDAFFKWRDQAYETNPYTENFYVQTKQEQASIYERLYLDATGSTDNQLEQTTAINSLPADSSVQEQLRRELAQLYEPYQVPHAPEYSEEFYIRRRNLINDIAERQFLDGSQEMLELSVLCRNMFDFLSRWSLHPTSAEGETEFARFCAQCQLPIFQRWFSPYEQVMLSQGKVITYSSDLWNNSKAESDAENACCDTVKCIAEHACPTVAQLIWNCTLGVFFRS